MSKRTLAIVCVALWLGAVLIFFPSHARGGNVKSEPPPAASTPGAGKSAKQLMQEAEALRSQAEAKLAEAVALKTKAYEQHNTALQDPNSLVERSPETWGQLGAVDVEDKPKIEFFKLIAGKVADADALTVEHYEPKIRKRLELLEPELESICRLEDWKLMSMSFTIGGGKVKAPPERRELSPASDADKLVANCIGQELAKSTWENMGDDVNVYVVWRIIGGP